MIRKLDPPLHRAVIGVKVKPRGSNDRPNPAFGTVLFFLTPVLSTHRRQAVSIL